MQIIKQLPNLADRLADLCRVEIWPKRHLFKSLINIDHFVNPQKPGRSIGRSSNDGSAMKNPAKLVLVVSVVLALGSITLAHAQQPAKSKAPAKSAQTAPNNATPPAAAPADNASAANAPSPPGWIARCASASRDAPLECAIEQNAVLPRTGQLVIAVNIRVPADTHAPSALIQLPLGLNIPNGAKLQVDDGKVTDVQLQTCEARGCYAGTAIAPELLAAMKSGKQLKVSFQNLNKETLTVPLPLADFAAAYEKIK
jgi:invasion protein IalB